LPAPGLYEYPYGVSVGDVLEACGAKDVQAVQVSGPSGVCLSRREFSRRIAFEDIRPPAPFMVFDQSRDMFRGGAQLRPFLRPRELRLLHALPRRHRRCWRNLMDKLKNGPCSPYDFAEIEKLNRILQSMSHCGSDTRPAIRCSIPSRNSARRTSGACSRKEFEPAFNLDWGARTGAADDRARTMRGRISPRPQGRGDERELHHRRQTVAFSEGQTIIQAALAAGVYIPHLCYHPSSSPHGSCKLCTVKIGARRTASCTTLAQAGMVVESNTRALNDERRTLIEMLFVEGNHFCPSCEKSGDCKLQATAYDLGMMSAHFDHFFPSRPVDASHPDVLLDFNRCILCSLCVRASRDVDGKTRLRSPAAASRRALIVNAKSGRLADTDVTLQDKAVQGLSGRRDAEERPRASPFR